VTNPTALWSFLLAGYLTTIGIETPILLIGLSRPHSIARRIVAGVWLTACTYPIVVLVLPLMPVLASREAAYLIVAETFAPVAECLIFRAAFHADRAAISQRDRARDYIAIVIANLASFGLGEVLSRYGWWTGF
jgi:hypothetical protein